MQVLHSSQILMKIPEITKIFSCFPEIIRVSTLYIYVYIAM